MKKSVEYHIWPRHMRFEDKLMLLEEFASKRRLQRSPVRGLSTFRAQVDRYQWVSCDTLEELAQYMKRYPAYEAFKAEPHYRDEKGDEELSMEIRRSASGRTVDVAVSSGSIDLVESAHAMIREEFQLSNPAVPVGDGTRDEWLNPTVFVGRHFDAKGDEYFAALAEFLTLLGFDVKQGKEYRSQTVPAKVKDRIDSQDIFIAIVSGDRASEWLREEGAYALGKDKHVLLMVEEGASYEPALLGRDLEQIRFPAGQIEKTFIPLLQEFTSVRVKGIF